MVGKIIVAPLNDLSRVLSEIRADFVISVLGPSDKVAFPRVACKNLLQLNFDDAGVSTNQLIAPSKAEIDKILSFSRAWGGVGNFVVHCKAGTSRSPAAAMIAAASINRLDVAARVAKARPYFRPNRTMLRLADEIFTQECAIEHGLVALEASIVRPDKPTDVRACTIAVR
jgi:predicted protein tyrosine phosphatase